MTVTFYSVKLNGSANMNITRCLLLNINKLHKYSLYFGVVNRRLFTISKSVWITDSFSRRSNLDSVGFIIYARWMLCFVFSWAKFNFDCRILPSGRWRRFQSCRRFSSVASIFGPPRKQLVWAPGQGVTATTSSWRAPGGPLQPRGPPRGRGACGACGALATPLRRLRASVSSLQVSLLYYTVVKRDRVSGTHCHVTFVYQSIAWNFSKINLKRTFSIAAVTPAPLRIIVMSGAILSVLLHYITLRARLSHH